MAHQGAPSMAGRPSVLKTLEALAVGLAVAAGAAAAQADEVADRSLAATCANCHGTDGRAQAGMPPLAGYPADRLVAVLQEFRSGQRPATIMHQIAKGYSEAQIQSLARYFSTRKPN